jgi:hypothetical protein
MVRRGSTGDRASQAHDLADVTLLVDIELPLLAPFRLATSTKHQPLPAVHRSRSPCGARATLFDGEAELAGATRGVRCVAVGGAATAYELEVALEVSPSATAAAPRRALQAAVDAAGTTVEYDFPEPPPVELGELLLGAPLLLALALRGTFCLHASAVLLPEGAVAFLGESGAGKSTLARELHRHGLARVADDLLLVGAGKEVDEPPVALPRFPQPRLAGIDQPAAAPVEARIAAIYLLGGPAARVERRRISTVDATLSLARHTVAARLFAPELLARHLAFVGSLAAATPLRHLRYPWRPGGTEAVAEAIREDLQAPGDEKT